MVNDIQAMNPVYNKWYMDDGGIIGDVELLKKVWELLQPSEMRVVMLGPDCSEPCPIRLAGVAEEDQVKLVPFTDSNAWSALGERWFLWKRNCWVVCLIQ